MKINGFTAKVYTLRASFSAIFLLWMLFGGLCAVATSVTATFGPISVGVSSPIICPQDSITITASTTCEGGLSSVSVHGMTTTVSGQSYSALCLGDWAPGLQVVQASDNCGNSAAFGFIVAPSGNTTFAIFDHPTGWTGDSYNMTDILYDGSSGTGSTCSWTWAGPSGYNHSDHPNNPAAGVISSGGQSGLSEFVTPDNASIWVYKFFPNCGSGWSSPGIGQQITACSPAAGTSYNSDLNTPLPDWDAPGYPSTSSGGVTLYGGSSFSGSCCP